MRKTGSKTLFFQTPNKLPPMFILVPFAPLRLCDLGVFALRTIRARGVIDGFVNQPRRRKGHEEANRILRALRVFVVHQCFWLRPTGRAMSSVKIRG
jgi:hypothetical protein